MAKEPITIELSAEEALVLFEFLWRFSQDDVLKIEDQAEERLLWDLCSSLESKLVAPFAQEYRELLAVARSKVRDKDPSSLPL